VKNNVQKAKESMQTLSTAGQGFLGGARRFIKGRIQRNRSEGAPSSSAASDDESDVVPPVPRRRLPFRNGSWGGRAASESADCASDVVDANAANSIGVDVGASSDTAAPVTPSSVDGHGNSFHNAF
jgi:hypothetical protein